MNDAARVADWVRFYEASTPDYRPHALFAVWKNERTLFPQVVRALKLDLPKLMEQMSA